MSIRLPRTMTPDMAINYRAGIKAALDAIVSQLAMQTWSAKTTPHTAYEDGYMRGLRECEVAIHRLRNTTEKEPNEK